MYEIPKIGIPVEIILVDGESIAGNIFVTEDLVSAGGNPLIEDLLNDDTNLFFPFESQAGAYRLINKRQIAFINTEQTDAEIREQTPIEPRGLVAHFTNERAVYGMVYPTLAEETRVSDLINQQQNFMAIFQEGRKIIVNRDHIIYVNAN